MDNPLVGVIMGSETELTYMEETERVLQGFGIPFETRILSPHRSPRRLFEYIQAAPSRGIHVLICGEGWAAHLAGIVASVTTLPVIGVPIPNSSVNGLDSLLSTVQMPMGVPVATMAMGKAGAANAAVLATQILSLKFDGLGQALVRFKEELDRSVEAKDTQLRQARQQGG